MFSKVYRHLASKGYDCYAPNQHQGLCTKLYLVIYDGETRGQGGNTVGQTMLDVMIVNPVNEHSKLESRVREVKDYLKELDFIQLTGFISGTMPQSEKKAHSKVIQCVNNRRL